MLMVLMLLLVSFRALMAIFIFIFFDSLINCVIYDCFKIAESASKHLQIGFCLTNNENSQVVHLHLFKTENPHIAEANSIFLVKSEKKMIHFQCSLLLCHFTHILHGFVKTSFNPSDIQLFYKWMLFPIYVCPSVYILLFMLIISVAGTALRVGLTGLGPPTCTLGLS